MSDLKPFKIIIEWSGYEDFYFSCDYDRSDMGKNRNTTLVDKGRTFPFMTQAMGNVLRKLRKEHISFPLFLVTLAFNHRDLLHEIDQLLHLLHLHIKEKQVPGTFSYNISSTSQELFSSQR
ncbi:MAG: hypothetical protein HGA59_05585 [Chlorobiaceae bacterium]|nr:hypothetical protein [Chlorobiaceae bacterium]NTV17656.1 hypothetical protein [Chlorobiaceae bacterium]